MTDYALDPRIRAGETRSEPLRAGFGRGLLEAGRRDQRVVALCADLTESTQMHLFQREFPDRFIEVGIAEQNLVTVAAGLAHAGKIPFTSSYAAYSPGRNWEQIKTTAALNNRPVKIIGSHTGLNVGPDGATHQMLEDIALMRVMPNMIVLAPGDSIEAEKATIALAKFDGPGYLRLTRDATPVFSTEASPFEIGRGYLLRDGADLTLVGTGTMTAQVLVAAELLARIGLDAQVLHMPTIKPLDGAQILEGAAKTGFVVTAEEAQVAGGLGGAIAELLSERLPTRLLRLGVQDRYGESGTAADLLEAFNLTGRQLAAQIQAAYSKHAAHA
jgi:transketolase